MLIKGGHGEGETVSDVLLGPDGAQTFTTPPIPGGPYHGTGCALSAAITAFLARGFSLRRSVEQAKAYITRQQAVTFLRKAADAGYVPALIELGLWYYGGRWVPQDGSRALACWKEAERRGSSEATLRLAVMSVRQSTDSLVLGASLATLRRASAQGAILADVALGYCYENGVVVPRSSSEAAQLYRAAWRRGSLDAYRSLRRLYDALRPHDPEFLMHD